MNAPARLCLSCCLVAFAACRREAPSTMGPEEQAPAPTNRIDVPESVRKNLGITFVSVERRAVTATLRLPGHFELLPEARYEHRTPMAGRVAIAVAPLQPVQPGTLLYTLDSPEWRRLQRELGQLETENQITAARIGTMGPLLEAHEVHEASLREAMGVLQDRLTSLEATRQDIGGQAQQLTDARVQLAQVRSQTAEAAEQHTETQALLAELRANLEAGQQRLQLGLAAASTLVGRTTEQLLASAPGSAPPVPLWRALAAIEVRAARAGIVDRLPVASGGWVETGELVLSVADLGKVRCRARGLQSDLGRLRDGLPTRLVPPTGGPPGGPPLPSVAGTLQLGAEADPVQRTIDLFVTPAAPPLWARPGVAAYVEIETEGGAPELAVPLAAVMTDGLQRVFFRRDPKNADVVIRVEADLGADDGRWVEVKSGLVDGDQVVLAGAYALMLASSGSAAKGGHFHADGTFHADDHK